MRAFFAIGLFGTVLALSSPAQQQQSSCSLELLTTPGTVSQMFTLPGGEVRVDVTGGAEATCGTMRVRADSASWYKQRGAIYMFGNVDYREATRTLLAERATYFQKADWVRAEGNVRFNDTAGGSSLTGPSLDYYPQNAGRPTERMFAPGRPHVTFRPMNAAGQPSEPFDVDADRVHIYGDSLLAAAGRVVVLRGDLYASGDSLDADVGRDRIWLVGNPLVKAQEMDLKGDSILVLLEEDEVSEIHAWPNGSARGRELSITAPLLHLFVEAQQIVRTVASGGEAARAEDVFALTPYARSESPDYVLVADSIDILRPDGRLERVIAIGRARATTKDIILPEDSLLSTDWMEGDTITGHFTAVDSAGAEASQVRLERLVAAGQARALYHLRDDAQSERSRRLPGVNYVIGRIVTIWLEAGEVRRAQVVGPSTGVYLEPLPVASNGDSVTVVGDSLQAPADTIVAERRDTTGVAAR